MSKENFIKITGNKIRYLEAGKSDETIILIHGLGASAERWKFVVPYLTKKYHIIIPDLIGFGYSDKPVIDYTVGFFVKFLLDFLDNIGIKKTIMIGSSLGGQIVAEFAIMDNERLKKMVLVSPSGFMDYSTSGLEAYMMAALNPSERNAKQAFQMISGSNNQVDLGMADEFLKRITLPNAQTAFISALMNAGKTKIDCKKLSTLSIPTLIVWGSLDAVIPPENAKGFFSCLKNYSYIEMDRCGHAPYVDQPEEFSKLVLEFLGSGITALS